MATPPHGSLGEQPLGLQLVIDDSLNGYPYIPRARVQAVASLAAGDVRFAHTSSDFGV